MARVTPRLISLKVATVDRSNEISQSEITSAASDRDFMSFAEARAGGARDYALVMTIAQDHASATLWDLIWTGAGTLVAGVYAPYGNTTPTVSQPHYTFDAKVSEPDGTMLGAEANDSTTAVATVQVTWPLSAKPTKLTA